MVAPMPVGGISGMSSRGVDTVFQRDIGLVLPDIEKRTFQFVEAFFIDTEDTEALNILGILAQFWVTSYAKIKTGEIRDILSLNEMYKYIGEQGEKGFEIEALVNRVYFLMMRSYFMVTQDISHGMQSDNESMLDYAEVVTALSLLPPSRRKKFIRDITREQILPQTINLNKFAKPIMERLEEFVSKQEKALAEFNK